MLRRLLDLIFVCSFTASVFTPNIRAQVQQPSTVWQFSIPLEATTERRAYLWIPPHCFRIRGVLVGLQNMLERPMFEDPAIRAGIAESDMAILWISPGAWPGNIEPAAQPSLAFTPQADAVKALQRVLTRLSDESGYYELQFAPILVTGHSAAGPFVWGLAEALPERVFAALPYKNTVYKEYTPVGVPTFYIAQEWAEWGASWGDAWHKELAAAVGFRKRDPDTLLGVFADIGAGHFDFSPRSAPILAMFIRKAARARLPDQAPVDAPVHLKPIAVESGVLVDPGTLGTPAFRAVPYGQWKGDRATGLWYFDAEMAEAVNSYMLDGLSRKPQAIDFTVAGIPAPLLANGFAVLKPEFLPDGFSFRVHAESLSTSPRKYLYGGGPLGRAATPITYRVSSGALEQLSADTFRVVARSGGFIRQGLPWEPWIMGIKSGDRDYRSTDKPAHILIEIRNTKGLPQSLRFDPVASVNRKTLTVPLRATASSGLPVQFYVESGPAIIEGDHLRLLSLPPRTRYPARVIVSAFQWGRVGDGAVQSAGPQTQEFSITR